MKLKQISLYCEPINQAKPQLGHQGEIGRGHEQCQDSSDDNG